MQYLEELKFSSMSMGSFILKAFYENFQVVRITETGEKKETIFDMALDLGGRLYGLSAQQCQDWGFCGNTLKKNFQLLRTVWDKEVEAAMMIWSVLSVLR